MASAWPVATAPSGGRSDHLCEGRQGFHRVVQPAGLSCSYAVTERHLEFLVGGLAHVWMFFHIVSGKKNPN